MLFRFTAAQSWTHTTGSTSSFVEEVFQALRIESCESVSCGHERYSASRGRGPGAGTVHAVSSLSEWS